MIYITGDIHGNPKRLSKKNFKCRQIEYPKKNDIIIICGDFGLVWNNKPTKEEIYWLDWLTKQEFTVAFVDGNHENFDMLNLFPVKEWNGGLVHIVRKNIFHLMRGEVFNINGFKIFCFGGALSVDKAYRVENVSWWKEEIFSPMELLNAKQNLQKNNYKVDVVVTHTAPRCFLNERSFDFAKLNNDQTLKMLSDLELKIEYSYWYFGHFHENFSGRIGSSVYRGIYDAIDTLE